MENNNRFPFVPYHDPTADDNPSTEQIFAFSEEGPSLGFNQFPENPLPSSLHKAKGVIVFPQSDGAGGRVGGSGGGGGDGGEFWDPEDPLSDPLIWDMLNDSSGKEEAGPSGANDERFFSPGNAAMNVDIPASADFGNPIHLSIWPLPPTPYNCSCCHILREIIHTNGIHIANLEVHGRLGMISHAILDEYDFDFSTQNHVYRMYDFCKESIANVKNFLLQYCEFRKWEGYTVVQDPLSIFYDALCVGLDENGSQNTFLQPTQMPPGNFSMPQQQEDIVNQQNVGSGGPGSYDHQETLRPQQGESSRGLPKSSLATQRERTGKMKMKDFSGYFHLTINDAAKKMGVCPTVIKKKCREGGLSRWPYRKIKGIKRKISMKEHSLASATAEERARALPEIQMLEQELANVLQQLTTQGSRSCY